MIAAMNLAVAVGAIGGDNEAIDSRIGCIAVIQEAADMRSPILGRYTRVALLAQMRTGFFQQRRMIRARHVVAECAVFGGRLVLPQEGPAFLGVAAITVLVDSELLQ